MITIPICTAVERTTVQRVLVFFGTALEITRSSNMFLPPCSGHHSSIGCGSGPNGSSPLTMILVPKHHDRCRNPKTGVCSYHNSHHHGKREGTQYLPSHEIQHENRQK